MTNRRRLIAILTLIVLAGGALDGQEIVNWPAPPFWSRPVELQKPAEGTALDPQAIEGIPSPPLPFVATVPCRIADTRGNGFTGQAGPPALSANVTRTFQITGTVSGVPAQCGIPAGAEAVSFQFTVVQPSSAGNLIAWPTGAPPSISVLNWSAGEFALGNGIVVPLSGTGGVNVFVNAAASQTAHLTIDVNGYYGGTVVTSVTAGTGLSGGGTGAVTVGIANGGVNTTQLADGAVTSTKIGANAVTAGAIASGQVVKSLNGLHDSVTVAGSGSITVGTAGSTITVGGGGTPAGSFLLGNPGDTTLIAAGYTELGSSNVDLWSATSTTGAPTARSNHTAVWTGTKMVVWGGAAGGVFNTGGQYDPVANSWTATTTTGAPSGRTQHTAVWSGSKMIVWGGFPLTNTGGQYDPVANSWTATTTTGAPSGRTFHTPVWTGSKMIIWGGYDGSDVNTGGQYDPVGNSWTATTTTGAPTARSNHTAVWTGTKMIVWSGTPYTNTGGQYDPGFDSWTATTTTGAPTARAAHEAVWTGSKMIVWGGYDGSYANTGGQYDPVGDSWIATTTAGAPTGRQEYTAVWTGSKMIIWGGDDDGLAPYLNTGGHYDPVGNSWTATTTTGAPAARYGHTAVWTGSRMIVWGGYDVTNLNTGGRYTILSLYVKN